MSLIDQRCRTLSHILCGCVTLLVTFLGGCGLSGIATSSEFKRTKVMNTTVTIDDLELIRNVTIEFYSASNYTDRDKIVAELKDSNAWVDPDGVARLGIWKMEDRKGRLALVRHPPVSENMIYYGVFLTRTDKAWRVKDGWYEIRRMRRA